LALSHLLVLVVGFVIGFLISPPVVVMPDRGGQRPNMASPAPQGDQKK
jgi:hypothetical protein